MQSTMVLSFHFYVNADDRNSLINAAHFDQGGLGFTQQGLLFQNMIPPPKISGIAYYRLYHQNIYPHWVNHRQQAAAISKISF